MSSSVISEGAKGDQEERGGGEETNSNRNCWTSRRERERRQARFSIRVRVINNAGGGDDDDDDDDDASNNGGNNQQQQHYSVTDEDFPIIKELLKYILKGNRSKFSITLINQHHRILSSQIPINYLHLKEEGYESNTYLSHALQKCHAWFGKDYSERIRAYVEQLSTFTIIEFAVWMGKYTIAGSLLVGGINPCIRGYVGGGKENGYQGWEPIVGSKVLRRFFDCFPLLLSTYIIKRVVDLRVLAPRKVLAVAAENGDRSPPLAPFCCKLCKNENMHPSLCFTHHSCGCTICEPCFWLDIIQNIDDRGNLDDVVICPMCKQSYDDCGKGGGGGNETHEHDQGQHEKPECLTPAPTGRAKKSLMKFNDLPANRKALKGSSKRRKTTKESEAIASNWLKAVQPSLGLTQDVRKDKFFNFVERNAIHYVKGCLEAGVDINWQNEYGQTCLYISIWRYLYGGGSSANQIARLLMQYGANPSVAANGGSTALNLLHFHRHHQNGNSNDNCEKLILMIQNYDTEKNDGDIVLGSQENIPLKDLSFESTVGIANSLPLLQILIPPPMSPLSNHHPGAGSYIIDNAISSSQVQILLDLHSNLPIDVTQKKKNLLCSERSYFCDADLDICQLLERVICQVGLAASSSTSRTRKQKGAAAVDDKIQTTAKRCKVLPHMRFLNYSNPGGSLSPHVDLCRVDSFCSSSSTGERPHQERRSTHTLILYLTTCQRGGETSLLEENSPESNILSSISVVQGRMLLFPHPCPHQGNEVVDVPKILLRGELILD